MSTHNIQFHDKSRTFPEVFVFWSFQKKLVGTQKRVKLSMVNELSEFELLRFDCIVRFMQIFETMSRPCPESENKHKFLDLFYH